eukprot:CAMPEP_0202400428 /NCGR_PEP_ID=MMETSP1128-20130828/2722_1 /ASSEMBLY_ACC=CAM_ASM_000463 /TAXON_ID=3047 /ORGANISM="Dunaliella tertiolecta, Strain CCMP1320" /LENGTH=682 /DNA_ID=CAMNT_0049003971 /DNA_START=28 /DNA_END=2073 /DNA_ORIENTATION=-
MLAYTHGSLLARCFQQHLCKAWARSFGTTPSNSNFGGGAVSPEHTHPVASRWLKSVNNSTLQHDENQWAVVQRLSSLYDDVCVYAQQVYAHQQEVAAYKARFDARLAELHATQPDAPQGPSPEVELQDGGGVSGLLAAWLPSWLVPAGERTGRQMRQLTPMQREHLRKARLREQVLKELGHPPKPPSSPKGVYLYGSVGSGKTLLMDIFYSALAQNSHHLGITKHRRVHFNTAMLEIHKLLHDQDRQQRQATHQGVLQHHHNRQGDNEQASSNSSSTGGLNASEDLYESGRMRRSFGMQGDEVAQQQKTSKKAVMAIRKYLSLSRMGRIPPEAVAASNSRCVALAAAGLLESAEDMHKLEAKVLCFDEMQVADVFSAVALKGIVEWITSCGGVMILTSNRAPEELPRHGLHEGMFSHFVDALNNTCDVVPLSSSTDYRMQMLAQGRQQQQQQQHAAVASPDTECEHALDKVYACPMCPATQEHLNRVWATVTQGAAASSEQVPVLFGRTLSVRKAARGAAYFHFAELCAAVTGPADFTALAQHYHTLFIHGVPAMSMQIRDQARRFITLVDELYNNKVLLVLSSEVPPEELFSVNRTLEEPILDLEQLQYEGAVEGSKLRTDLSSDAGVTTFATSPTEVKEAKALLGGLEEQFAFARALSRLYEMQSQAYIRNWRETTLENW